MTVTAAATVDQVVINSGGQVTLNTGITLSVSNGTGTDLNVNGIYNSAGTTNLSGSVTVAFGSGSTYIHNQNGGTILTASWNSNSTCRITGVSTTFPAGTSQTFGHLSFNSPLISIIEIPTNLTVNGNLNIAGTGIGILSLTNSSANRTITVGGNLNDSAGTFCNVNNSGTGTISVTGNFNLVGGTFNLKSGNGTAALNVTGNMNLTSGTFVARILNTTSTSTTNVTGNFNMSGGTLNLSELPLSER